MNEHDQKKKEIRFINSHYQDLFRIPDGAYIQIDTGNKVTSARCTFLDEYHTQIGRRVYHICEFAEIMERNRCKYQPEPETEEAQTVWKVGNDQYLKVTVHDGAGYYAVYDGNGTERSEGYLDCDGLSINEARNQMLDKLGLGNREIMQQDYGEFLNLVDMHSFEALSNVDVKLGADFLTTQLFSFAKEHGFYDKPLLNEDADRAYETMFQNLTGGKERPYQKWLAGVITGAGNGADAGRAQLLMDMIDQYKEGLIEKGPEKARTSVKKQLTHKTDKQTPAKYSRRHKEPER